MTLWFLLWVVIMGALLCWLFCGCGIWVLFLRFLGCNMVFLVFEFAVCVGYYWYLGVSMDVLACGIFVVLSWLLVASCDCCALLSVGLVDCYCFWAVGFGF